MSTWIIVYNVNRDNISELKFSKDDIWDFHQIFSILLNLDEIRQIVEN